MLRDIRVIDNMVLMDGNALIMLDDEREKMGDLIATFFERQAKATQAALEQSNGA